MKGDLKMARTETRETRLSALVSTALLGCALLVVPAVAEDIEAIDDAFVLVEVELSSVDTGIDRRSVLSVRDFATRLARFTFFSPLWIE
jgi:hypothetical protein